MAFNSFSIKEAYSFVPLSKA